MLLLPAELTMGGQVVALACRSPHTKPCIWGVLGAVVDPSPSYIYPPPPPPSYRPTPSVIAAPSCHTPPGPDSHRSTTCQSPLNLSVTGHHACQSLHRTHPLLTRPSLINDEGLKLTSILLFVSADISFFFFHFLNLFNFFVHPR